MERAVPVDCGEGRNRMLFESCHHAFGGVDPVIVGWDEVDVNMVVLDVCFDGLGALIVHYVERGCIPTGVEVRKNVCEHCNHGIVVYGRHGANKDGIQVVNVCHKYIFCAVEGSHEEGTVAIAVNCPGV